MTGPSNGPRGSDRRASGGRLGEPRTGERSVEPRTGERRRTRASTLDRPAPPAERKPWHERYGVRIRWATWIGVALIAIRLMAPRPDGWRRWKDAAQALADVEQARTAALLSYQSADRTWPAPGRPGVVPPAMLPFLPGDVSFSRLRYRLAWEYAADTVSGARVIGISVTGDDPKLALTMARRAPQGMPFIVSGRRFVVLIASASGR